MDRNDFAELYINLIVDIHVFQNIQLELCRFEIQIDQLLSENHEKMKKKYFIFFGQCAIAIVIAIHYTEQIRNNQVGSSICDCSVSTNHGCEYTLNH